MVLARHQNTSLEIGQDKRTGSLHKSSVKLAKAEQSNKDIDATEDKAKDLGKSTEDIYGDIAAIQSKLQARLAEGREVGGELEREVGHLTPDT